MRYLICILSTCLFFEASIRDLSAEDKKEKSKDWVYLENDHFRLGLLRSHGGAIGHLSLVGNNENLLNHYDHGRLVQQSYYGDADGSRWVKKPWRYNPVQGGNYKGTATVVNEFKSTETSAYARTTPRHWASGTLLTECSMEQWIELDGPVVHLRYKFSYNGSQAHKARHQETPAVFISPKLKTLVTYAGSKPWTGDTLNKHIPGWPNESVSMSENWAAYVDDQSDGIGIYVPGSTKATCYRYEGGQGSNCSYVAPLRTFSIKPGLTFSYRAYLTAGNIKAIRARFETLRNSKN